MPFSCAVAGWSHQSRFQKTPVFYSFPNDEKLRRKWIRAIALRRKNYEWKSSDKVCSAHFPGGHKYGINKIPSIFPRRDPKTSQIVWPADISPLLKETRHSSQRPELKAGIIDEISSDISGNEDENEQTLNAAANPAEATSQIVDEELNHVASHAEENDNDLGTEIKPVRGKCKEKIDQRLGRIKVLEEQREIERSGVKKFMLSDGYIMFYDFVALHSYMNNAEGNGIIHYVLYWFTSLQDIFSFVSDGYIMFYDFVALHSYTNNAEG